MTSIKLDDTLSNKLDEYRNNIGFSRTQCINKLLDYALNLNKTYFEDMIIGRNIDHKHITQPINISDKPKDQPMDKVLDQSIIKVTDKPEEKKDGDYYYPDFRDRGSPTPNLLDIRTLKKYKFCDKFCDKPKKDYTGIIYVLAQESNEDKKDQPT